MVRRFSRGKVQARRTGRPFLFLGCRFDDQMLRIFARQIAKRRAEHYREPDQFHECRTARIRASG